MVDDMAFIYSMQSKTALHGPGCFMMNTGQTLPGFPSMGAWVTYGLGSECDNLPAFVVLPDPRGLPPGGPINWGAGFLPAVHQATTLDATPLSNPSPIFSHRRISRRAARSADTRASCKNSTRSTPPSAQTTPNSTPASPRMKWPRVFSSALPKSPTSAAKPRLTKKLYAIDDPEIGPFGRQCLMARRLAERGVRFIQIYCGAENTTAKKIRPNWDSHEDLVRDHGYWGAVLDTGASALLADLKSRGLLEDTLVICTTEFGRQPAAQGSGKGRDHNAGAFTAWMAGGGIQGGTGYGSTDELGFKAVENITHSYELHATALHLLGIDHEKLTFYHNGLQQRLTGLEGHGVIKDLLA
jgi:hypothetical protein